MPFCASSGLERACMVSACGVREVMAERASPALSWQPQPEEKNSMASARTKLGEYLKDGEAFVRQPPVPHLKKHMAQ